jgi:hypothetical protein
VGNQKLHDAQAPSALPQVHCKEIPSPGAQSKHEQGIEDGHFAIPYSLFPDPRERFFQAKNLLRPKVFANSADNHF